MVKGSKFWCFKLSKFVFESSDFCYIFYHIWLKFSAFSFGSDLFNISCWEDANFALTLAEPPVVLLLVVDVDHVPVADAQLVVPGQDAVEKLLSNMGLIEIENMH